MRDRTQLQLLSLGCSLSIALFTAAPAFACSISAPPYLTLEDVTPMDGSSGFTRNGAIRVRVKVWPADGHNPPPVLGVRVERADNGAVVDGVLDTEDAFARVVIWTPRAALEPNQSYRVQVTTGVAARGDIEGPVQLDSTFTTSAELAPPLSLKGELHATLREGTVPILECGPCSAATCHEVGRLPALFADVELPPASGGFDDYGYRAWLTLSDDTAQVFDGPGEGLRADHVVSRDSYLTLTPGTSLVQSIELPQEDKPYAACFGFNVWDPIGQSVSAAPLCISRADLAAAFARLPPIGDAGLPVEPRADAGESPRTRGDADDSDAAMSQPPRAPNERKSEAGGCTATRASGSSHGAAFVCGLIALVLLRRRQLVGPVLRASAR